jgi:hypothetical protein
MRAPGRAVAAGRRDAGRARAISGDAPFLAALRATSFRGTVHSVFEHALNIRGAADGRLYTLAAAGSDSAPSTLVVDIASFERFAMRPGMPVAVADALLSAGRLRVAFDAAAPWSAALPTWPPAGVRLRSLERLLDRHGVAGGIKPRPHPASLRTRDTVAAHRHGAGLIGLGPGLTPSGDDYVLGLATACALLGPRAAAQRQILAGVIDDNAARTNDISHAAMAHAVRGRVRQSLVDLAIALADGDRAALGLRADRVIAIGATSGTDILAGLLAGLALTTTED